MRIKRHVLRRVDVVPPLNIEILVVEHLFSLTGVQNHASAHKIEVDRPARHFRGLMSIVPR